MVKAQRKTWMFWLLAFLIVGILLACGQLPSVTGLVTTPTSASPFQSHPALNTWYSIKPGIALRYEHWSSPGDNDDTVTIVRMNPKDIHLSVDYHPNEPTDIRGWMQQTHATVLINGGYFDQDDHATALIISNGQVTGTSYEGFGGMLSVNKQGTIQLRSLRTQPYTPTEQLEQATQSSPMLMVDGKRTQFSADAASQRRTVVAMDKQGNLLFIISPNEAFSLDELADLLVASDLSLETALNLDGGASTGLAIDTGQHQQVIDSITALPIVIAVS
jgi:hypothetical protein